MLGLAPFGALFCFPRSTLGGPVSVAAIDSEAADASTACVDGRFVKFLIDFPNPHDGSAARLRHGFGPPLRSLAAHAPEQVRGVLDAVQQAAQAGLWCLGWVRYEAAAAFDAAYAGADRKSTRLNSSHLVISYA